MVAYRELYGTNSQIDVIVIDLDDEAMIKMMAHENQQDWSTLFVNEMETVQSNRQSVWRRAHPTGEPKKVGSGMVGGYLRYAPASPCVVLGQSRAVDGSSFPYTAQSIGEFLGCLEKDGKVQAKISDSLTALELIETKIATIEMFVGLNNYHARTFLQQIRTAGERVSSKKRASYRTQAGQCACEIATRAGQRRHEGDRIRRARPRGDRREVRHGERRIDRRAAEDRDPIECGVKQGKIGIAEATKITDRVAPFVIDRIIPNQAKFCKGLQRDIWKILSEKHDRKRAINKSTR